MDFYYIFVFFIFYYKIKFSLKPKNLLIQLKINYSKKFFAESLSQTDHLSYS